jgi:hypothetical protein
MEVKVWRQFEFEVVRRTVLYDDGLDVHEMC